MQPLFACLFAAAILTGIARSADVDQALTFGKRTENKLYRAEVKPTWLPDGKSFWYRVQTSAETFEFVWIDAATGSRKTAADLKSLGLTKDEKINTSALKVEIRPTQRTGQESGFKFINKLSADVEILWINQDGEKMSYGLIKAGAEHDQHTFEGHVWLITTHTGEPLAVVEGKAEIQTIVIDGQGIKADVSKAKPKSADSGSASPDGKWSAFIDSGKVQLRETSTGKVTPLKAPSGITTPFQDGLRWSPDSESFVVSQGAMPPKRRVTIVESTPEGQLQPKLREFDYRKPGDPLPQPVPVIFRLNPNGSHESTRVKTDLFPTPFTQAANLDVRWARDSSEFYYDYNQRGHQLYRILATNANTGETRVVVEETSKTFIDYTHKTWRHWLDNTGELIWMSERDGWCHLWLYDIKTGQPKRQITRGQWPVREVLYVDEANRELWFMASGLRANEDPYHLHLCRVNFDGGAFQQLTEGNGHHSIEFPPNREFFIDTWSRIDQSPVNELRRSADGSLVCVLEKAEAKDLLATGWTLPERFVAKGRDGKTDIHGILIKPSNFDPQKKYPVVEEIYAGPHGAFTPKTFGRLVRHHMIAELGFIVVQMDGMGTNHRGKTFHDVCWKNLKDAGFPDRIAWIKAAAQTRPWMDLTRIGIYGGSAGGQNAMRALIDHHDFYKVAIADCGCHDNRMDKIWWNEQWLGWPIDESYVRNSNFEDAARLEGNLLLIVGELDDNVDPATTMQVVGALQRAKKSFEFMPIIGAGHGAAETPYGSRLRMEFLIKHLRP